MDQFFIVYEDPDTQKLQAILEGDGKSIRLMSQDDMIGMSIQIMTKYQVVKLSFTSNP